MKYIKSYKIFESNYSFEEYISALCDELSNYNVSPVVIKSMLDKYENDINDAISNEITPNTFMKKVVDEMSLSDDGGFPSQYGPPSKQTTVKYL
jgi:hypothetical protein